MRKLLLFLALSSMTSCALWKESDPLTPQGEAVQITNQVPATGCVYKGDFTESSTAAGPGLRRVKNEVARLGGNTAHIVGQSSQNQSCGFYPRSYCYMNETIFTVAAYECARPKSESAKK